MAQHTEDNTIIVIGRQYGSGGRKLGSLLAKELGMEYYDKELLSQASERLGINPELFARSDEKRPSIMQRILMFTSGSEAAGSCHPSTGALDDESIYKMQSDIIRQLSEQGPCVFVGRTADYVLRDNPNLLSIFIHSPLEQRVKRIMEREAPGSEEKAADIIRHADRKREEYYNYFTGRSWGKASNYHLSFDSSRLSYDEMIAIIKHALHK